MPTIIDYKRILSELRDRRSELDLERDQVMAALKVIGPLAGVTIEEEAQLPGLLTEEDEVDIAPDEFTKDSIAEAVKRYLTKVGKPQSTNNICNALKKGGLPSSSEKFYSTIYSTIARNDSIFCKISNTWGLKSWDEIFT